MNIRIIKVSEPEFPATLRTIAGPPRQLFASGVPLDELMRRPRLAVVGSRKTSPYGRTVTQEIVRDLAARGVVIVSGLAVGIDGIAHQAALEAGGFTIAVLPGSIDTIYPASHAALATRIVERGGALVSEYAGGAVAFKSNFIARNRLVSGLSDGVLIVEAALQSGTLHTARFALEQNREVMAVPGNITSANSAGTNNLIKAGAAPITEASDVLHVLGLVDTASAAAKPPPHSSQPDEQLVLNLIHAGTSDGGELQRASQLATADFNQILTMLEIKGKIRAAGSNQWMLH